MAVAPSKADALRIEDPATGDGVEHLEAVGAVPGVVIRHVAALNGPGTGMLRIYPGTVPEIPGPAWLVAWRAPGSSTFGDGVAFGGSSTDLVVADGEDADKFVRVDTVIGRVPAAAAEAEVLVTDRYGNAVASDDVTAAEASAGDVETYTLDMHNEGSQTLDDLTVWLDAAVTLLEISDDGVSWSAPTTEASGINFGAIAGGGKPTLHVRRTIGAGAAADPKVLAHLHLSWSVSGTKYYHDARGLHRIFNAAEYRFYRKLGSPPAEGDAPFDTASALPHTPTDTFGDGVWYLSMSRFNGVIDSGFRPLGPAGETYVRLEISGGQVVANPPQAPLTWEPQAQAGGVVRITGAYLEVGGLRADEWAIAWRTGAATPPADNPDIVLPIAAGSAGAILSHDLPAQADGVNVRVRVQTRRSLGGGQFAYSEGSSVKQIQADAAGPSAPLEARRYPGRLPRGF